MTSLIESRKYLEEFRLKQEGFFKIQKDTVADEIFSTSPDRTFHYSSSLEKQDLSAKQAQPQANRAPSPAEADSKKCRVVVFEANSQAAASFEFKREPLKIDEAALRSALTAAFARPPSSGPSNANAASAKAPAGTGASPPAGGAAAGGIPITIHLPFGRVIKMRIDDTATVDQILTLIIRQYPTSMIPSPKAYVMRMAEEDGTPEEDFPALTPTGPISRFGKMFVVCKNPDYKDSANPPPPNPNLVAASSALAAVGETNSNKKESRQSLNLSASSTLTPGSTPERRESLGSSSSKTLKVHLPNMQYITVQWQANQKVQQVLAKICQKRLIDSSGHHFQLLDTPMAINPEITLGELGVTEIKLCPNK